MVAAGELSDSLSGGQIDEREQCASGAFVLIVKGDDEVIRGDRRRRLLASPAGLAQEEENRCRREIDPHKTPGITTRSRLPSVRASQTVKG